MGVNRVYGQVVTWDDCYFRLMPGELSFLVGPSGAGKTTLLRLINREIKPSAGEVWVGSDPGKKPGAWVVGHMRVVTASGDAV